VEVKIKNLAYLEKYPKMHIAYWKKLQYIQIRAQFCIQDTLIFSKPFFVKGILALFKRNQMLLKSSPRQKKLSGLCLATGSNKKSGKRVRGK